jgi:hypothetical protein
MPGAAARHIGARPPSGATPRLWSGTVTFPTRLQAMFPGTWTDARSEEHARRKPAGVTRPLLSQSSDSTSRLGRNTEGPDAQSRSGADCETARKHRTRSTLQIASGMRPSNERDLLNVTEIGTNVKTIVAENETHDVNTISALTS